MLPVPSTSQPTDDDVEWVKVPVVLVERSFVDEHEAELREIFQRSSEQLRRHTADWQQSVRRMRDNFIRLHPVDDLHHHHQPAAAATVSDTDRVRTLFFEYPPAVDDHDVMSTSTPSAQPPTRYQVRFDVSDCASTSVTVTGESSTIVVRATAAASADHQSRTARVLVPPGVLRDTRLTTG